MTDHKAEALDLIDSEYVQGRFNGRRDASLMLSEAQVHATLYLAEQQRIANLIAYGDSLSDNQRDGYWLTEKGQARCDLVESQIIEGLGL